MLDINLVPQNLRKKKKNELLSGSSKVPLEIIIGSAGGLVLLLICVHIGLFFVNLKKIATHRNLKKQWVAMESAKTNVDAVVNELRALQAKLKDVEGMVGEESNIVWSQKLNIISDSLPRGVWLRKVALAENMLFIEGSAISRQGQQLTNVHQFTSNLKKDDAFMENFAEIEPGSMKKRKISTVEIADFLITVKLDE